MPNSKRVLIIEDEPDVRENIRDILRMSDFYTLVAEDGTIGLQMAQQETPDLILCDIMMPGLDGYEILQALRSQFETSLVPIIFLTARTARADQRRAMELGANDFITKPFQPQELLQAVESRFKQQGAIRDKIRAQVNNLRESITQALPHELHTPLTGLMGSLKFLCLELERLDQEDVRELLLLMDRSVDRLYKLTQNFIVLMELKTLEASSQQLHALRQVKVSTFTQALVEKVARQKAEACDRFSDLRLEVGNSLVAISELKLQKVLEELIDNAFKFSRTGSVVTISSLVADGFFRLFITDYGRGMTPAQIENIGSYQQFERQQYEQQGAGLGLSIAMTICRIYQGDIILESIPGQQTIVRLSLPLVSQTSV